MERVCIYLRKSRADLEAEARGEGETLAKHKNALLKTAKQQSLNIVRIREEIVSGESLVHRPEMLQLLKEVENGEYDAVLVMDIDRLGRGNMQEQGLILETFRTANVKIVTPRKVYDLRDEFDEEYSEFEAFMARKELKIITRRLQGGRIRSVEEGNYIGTRPPYGYLIHKTDLERILVPHPEQAPVVKMIFEWYTHNDPELRMGSSKISSKLNELKFETYTGKPWEPSTVLFILKNAVYAGRLQWKKKESKKSKLPGKIRDTRTRPKSEWIDVKGKHQPLIDEETFHRAQEILNKKYHVPYQLENGIVNPLAGLIRCDMCGSSMVLRPYITQPSHLLCYFRHCSNKSSQFAYVEKKLLDALELWITQYKSEWSKRKRPQPADDTNSIQLAETALRNLQRELAELEKQKSSLHDYLERKIYDEATYLERSRIVAQRIQSTADAIVKAESNFKTEVKREKAQKEIIPRVESVLKLYRKSEDPAKKNKLLKDILDYAVYRKEKHQRNDEFTLNIYPRLTQ